MSDNLAIFEATHGTAPNIAGQNKANPTSLLLSGAMMLKHMGYAEAGQKIEDAVEYCITNKKVTVDLSCQMEGEVKALSTSDYAEAVINAMK